jgi:DNA-binding IclR family transcriptional regulator
VTTPHPQTRRAEVHATLTVRGHATAPELAAVLDMPPTYVSSILGKLYVAGCVQRRPESPGYRYWVGDEPPPAVDVPPETVAPRPQPPRPYARSPRTPPPLEVVLLVQIAREPGSTTLDLVEVTGLSGPRVAAGLRNLKRWGYVEARGELVGWFVLEEG